MNYQDLREYEKYVGRINQKFKNKAQKMIETLKSVIEDCYVLKFYLTLLTTTYFPG